MTDLERRKLKFRLENPPTVTRKATKDLLSKKRYKEAIDLLYPDNTEFAPEKYQEINDWITTSNTEVKYIHKNGSSDKNALAYMFRHSQGCYRVFVNGNIKNKKTWQYFDLHEKGHAIFNHTVRVEKHIERYKKIINHNWKKIEKYFSAQSLKVYNKDTLVTYLYNEFSNTAQDMEINSKLFPDWKLARIFMTREALLGHLKSKHYRTIRKTIELFCDENKDTFCHPMNEGWLCDMDWMFYMTKLLDKIEDSVKNITFSAQGDEAGIEKEDSKGSIGVEDIKASQEKQNEISESKVEDGAEEDDDGSEKSINDDPSKGRGTSGTGKAVGKVIVKGLKSFEKYLSDKSLNEENRRRVTDMLWYSNRGRSLGGVLNPRRSYSTKIYPSNINVLIDVSGSVDVDSTRKVLQSLQNIKKNIDSKKSMVVQWDTQKKEESKLSDKDIKIYSGGCTRIAEGIDYIKKYAKKPTDKLFIISDCCDYLKDWVTIAKKVKAEKYVILYDYNHTIKNKADLIKYLKNNVRADPPIDDLFAVFNFYVLQV